MTLSDAQFRALTALADTYVAAVPPPDGHDPDGFYARDASAVGTPEVLATVLADPAAAPLVGLLDVLAGLEFAGAGLAVREGTLAQIAGSSPEAAVGLRTLGQLAIGVSYALPDASGTNPNWAAIGYPGPSFTPAVSVKDLATEEPASDTGYAADVVVIGSGAGGSVIAAEAAAAGRSVLVIEAGRYLDGEELAPYELVASAALYYRGNAAYTADAVVSLLAGATVGGGTTINWSNCVRPTAELRTRWAADHGLIGLDEPEFDAHLDAVAGRLGVTTDASTHNGPNSRLADGAAKLDWASHRAALNLDPFKVDHQQAGHAHYGDRTGARLGTTKTYLADAVAAGARILTGTAAERIVVADGRAVGVVASTVDGSTVTIEAGSVVVAAGALETPALLLRSGLGGPAVGTGLRLHPSVVVTGLYPDEQDPWLGPIQTAIVDEFAGPLPRDAAFGSGFLIETVAFDAGQWVAGLPWAGALSHKEYARRVRHIVPLVAILCDHGSGTVSLDATGRAVHHYPLDDPYDRRGLASGIAAVAQLHLAAGATEIYPLLAGAPSWHAGSPLEDHVAAWAAAPPGPGGHFIGSAHQMGSARMGTSPADSVADPTGRLHDVPNVWIGDTSAFPTALGVNPMITCMALARRTAGYLLA